MADPTDFRSIYTGAVKAIRETESAYGRDHLRMTYHLSPGTPAMQAVWIILSKMYPADLIQSSRQKGVQNVEFPFDIFAEYIPETSAASAGEVMSLAQGVAPAAPEFGDILHASDEMQQAIRRARRMALFDVPVLVLGESGTGKELFARAIHAASSRHAQPLLTLNCAALPEDLVESDLFGHEKGAFTNAVTMKKGRFELADKGSLFLDEIAELSPAIQAKLLRVLQEGEFTRVGGTKTLRCDVRIIGATNRNLMEQVRRGKFREDLYYRLAVGVILLPPLRKRSGDVRLLVDAIVGKINRKFSSQVTWENKTLTPGAVNRLLQHAWPGNVRELQNVLTRALVWCGTKRVDEAAIADALATESLAEGEKETVLGRDLGAGFQLEEVLAEIARQNIERALVLSRGNKTQAAKLLGLPSYQTLTNWMTKYEVVIS